MATVFAGEDLKHQRRVAIKVLRQEFSATIGAERFLREIRIAARLQHPHILPMHDSGEAAGMLYLVMPLVEGESLRARIMRQKEFAIADVVRILADVADALAYAHGKGIIHRDIKPDNIMIAGRHALVMDFGVAKALVAGQQADGDPAPRPAPLTGRVALGTPAYMAPEQAVADPAVDHRADLHALGVLAYELLAGRPPYTGMTAQDLLSAVVVLRPEPIESLRPDIPPALAQLVMKCLAKRPGDRWQSAEEVLTALEPLATPSAGITPHGGTVFLGMPAAPAWRWGTAGLAVLALAAVLALYFGSGRPKAPARFSQKQLTFAGNVTEAAISPDGESIAYVTEGNDGDHLMVQDLRGGASLTVASALAIRAPQWKDDGSEIFCHMNSPERGPGFVAVPRLGGQPRKLASRAASASPDGTRLVSFRAHDRELTLLGPGSDTATIAIRADYNWNLDAAWSPRKDRLLLFTSTPERDRVGLMVLSPDGRIQREVLDSSHDIRGPIWGPDGKGIYYFNLEGPLASLTRVALDDAGRPASPPVVLLTGLELRDPKDANPKVSVARDERRLVYVRETARANVAVAHLEGPGVRVEPRTTGTAIHSFPSVSPDGTQLAFLRSESRGYSLNVLPLRGGPARKLADLVEGYRIDWALDGQSLAVVALDLDGTFGIAVYGLDGTRRSRLAGGRTGGSLAWRSDGAIYHLPPANQGLMRVNPESGEESRVAAVDSTMSIRELRRSPDGRLLAFAGRTTTTDNALYLLGMSDEPPRVIETGNLLALGWDRSGKTLFATRLLGFTPREVYAYPNARGPGRLVATLPVGMIPQEVISERALLVLTEERSADVWLVEGAEGPD